MKPFMEGFTSQVSGYASGKARLWGSFKYIDMVGDIFAEDLKLKTRLHKYHILGNRLCKT